MTESPVHAYFFCAEFNNGLGSSHFFEGVLKTDVNPLDCRAFYESVKTQVAANMTPPRPRDQVVLRSLSRLS